MGQMTPPSLGRGQGEGTVTALVEAQAAARPGATYFIAAETGRSLTFGELRASCRRVAAFLARHGLQPGAHVSLVMPNGLATLRILLGAMYGQGWSVGTWLATADRRRQGRGEDTLRRRTIIVRSPERTSPVSARMSIRRFQRE